MRTDRLITNKHHDYDHDHTGRDYSACAPNREKALRLVTAPL